jgi:hypothetical protein
MPLLDAEPCGRTPVDIIDHLPDGRVVVRLVRVDAVMTVPPHLLLTDEGTEFDNRPRKVTLSASQITVLEALYRAGPFGLTDDEHEAISGLRADSAGVRRKELERQMYVTDTGDTRPTRRGSRARVWRITTAGEHALRQITHHTEGTTS